MQLIETDKSAFPRTSYEIARRTDRHIPMLNIANIVISGGAARSALLEATLGIVRPVRDIDVVGVDRSVSDTDFKDAHHAFNPTDTKRNTTRVKRLNNEVAAVGAVDFTLHEGLLRIDGGSPRLKTSTTAIADARARLITPTQSRIQAAIRLREGGEATHRQFLRDRTSLPARAAYLAATLRAAGNDFSIDLLDHPTPKKPSEAHRFFLGVMVKKTLVMDELERGAGDIVATQALFDIYRELGLADVRVPKTPEAVIAYCEDVNDQFPQLHFGGSEIAARVVHTSKAPPPKNP